MKNIITIQHTQSMQHTNGMIGSWADWDLTEEGKRQAERLGKRLSAEIGKVPYRVYASDLLRAKHTAQIVGGYLGVEPMLTKDLRELNLGEAVGKTKEWARQHARCAVWPNTIDWAANVDDRPFCNAESKRELWNRLSVFLNRIMGEAGENILLVAHDGSLSMLYALWLGMDVEMTGRICLSGCSGGVSFLREDSHKNRTIYRLNDLSYIRAAGDFLS